MHLLLAKSGLASQWKSEGRKWVVFFQDTNALFFNTVLAGLGQSEKLSLDMNSMAVPRKVCACVCACVCVCVCGGLRVAERGGGLAYVRARVCLATRRGRNAGVQHTHTHTQCTRARRYTHNNTHSHKCTRAHTHTRTQHNATQHTQMIQAKQEIGCLTKLVYKDGSTLTCNTEYNQVCACALALLCVVCLCLRVRVCVRACVRACRWQRRVTCSTDIQPVVACVSCQ